MIREMIDRKRHPELIKKSLRKENSKVKLSIFGYCKKNEIDINDLLDNKQEYADMLQWVKSRYSKSDIVTYMNDRKERRLDANILFPSMCPIPYPGFLAEALVESTDNESLSDLYHIYYSKRKIHAKARAIFKKDLFSNPDKDMGGQSISEFLEEELSDGTDTFGILKVPETEAFVEKYYSQYIKK